MDREVMMDREEKYMSHLQGVVKIPTVSSVNDENTDWSQFDRLHQYMHEAWPLISKAVPYQNRKGKSSFPLEIGKSEERACSFHGSPGRGACHS